MVEFLKTITGKDFSYEKAKRYVSLHQQMNNKYEDIVLVRQPNSPKNKNWWTEFPKVAIGRDFRILEDEETTCEERQKENKLLQL
jgi:hypothetical protein